jgi:hypothetical protein
MAEIFAIKNGNWSDTTLWSEGTLPATDDDVFSNGFTVTIDGNRTVSTIRNTATVNTLAKITTPKMTDSTLNGVTISAAVNSSTAWRAFNQDGFSTVWSTNLNTTSTWIKVEYPSAKIIKQYILKGASNNTGPNTWTFQGSNDDVSWTNLNSVTINLGNSGIYNSGELPNTTAYLYYRINVTAAQNSISGITISEIEMSETFQNVVGNTAGGFFTFANGGNLTCTNSQAIFVGILNTPVLQMTLSSGNVGTFTGDVLTIQNTTGFIAIRLSGTGTLNCIGNYNIDGSTSSTSSFKYLIEVTSSGTLNIIGNISSTFVLTGSNINCISMSSIGTINITGNIQSSTNTNFLSSPIRVSSGTLNITGNTTANVTPAVYLNGTVNYTQVGNVNASMIAPAISNIQNAATIDIIGITTSGSASPAISGLLTTFVKVRGNVINTDTYNAIFAGRVTIDDNLTFWQYKDSTNTINRTLYASGVSIGNPNEDDVREGVDYGPSLELTGTLAVPTPDNVRKGVPTDDTVGTADLTAEDILDAISISTNDVAVRLRNVSTVASTGAQIASYSV